MVILIGTASWADKSLVGCGRFYPKGCHSAEARLRHYASQFPIVEVDSSYYAMPAPATTQLWAERTPADFVMNVKAFRLFTGHATSPAVLHADMRPLLAPLGTPNLFYRDVPDDLRAELWRRFTEALVPLAAAGKLGLVHFQFPPWIVCNPDGLAHVRHCVERMAGCRIAIEFRHKSWFDGSQRASTLAFERELGVVHTVVDAPQGFDNSVPALWERTHPALALVRLHGRNADAWNIRGATASPQRFNYAYDDGELRDLGANVLRLADGVASTHVIFNNNMEDQGVRNAATLRRLIE